MAWLTRIRGVKDPIEDYAGDLKEPAGVPALSRLVHDNLLAHREEVVDLNLDADGFDDVVGQFHTLGWVASGPAGTQEAEFDAVLGALYDWADDNRVWVD